MEKSISIVNQLEHACGIVAEYTAVKLADNSGNDKWFKKANQAAEHKTIQRGSRKEE